VSNSIDSTSRRLLNEHQNLVTPHSNVSIGLTEKALIDVHKRSQSVSNRAKRRTSSPITILQKALLQIGQQSSSYQVKHSFVKQFSARLHILEQLAQKY